MLRKVPVMGRSLVGLGLKRGLSHFSDGQGKRVRPSGRVVGTHYCANGGCGHSGCTVAARVYTPLPPLVSLVNQISGLFVERGFAPQEFIEPFIPQQEMPTIGSDYLTSKEAWLQ